MFINLFQKLAAKLLRFLQNRAVLCNFLLLHIDILLFLPQKSIVYVTKEYKVTHNLSPNCFQNVIIQVIFSIFQEPSLLTVEELDI